jgi:hypothetical protein
MPNVENHSGWAGKYLDTLGGYSGKKRPAAAKRKQPPGLKVGTYQTDLIFKTPDDRKGAAAGLKGRVTTPTYG